MVTCDWMWLVLVEFLCDEWWQDVTGAYWIWVCDGSRWLIVTKVVKRLIIRLRLRSLDPPPPPSPCSPPHLVILLILRWFSSLQHFVISWALLCDSVQQASKCTSARPLPIGLNQPVAHIINLWTIWKLVCTPCSQAVRGPKCPQKDLRQSLAQWPVHFAVHILWRCAEHFLTSVQGKIYESTWIILDTFKHVLIEHKWSSFGFKSWFRFFRPQNHTRKTRKTKVIRSCLGFIFSTFFRTIWLTRRNTKIHQVMPWQPSPQWHDLPALWRLGKRTFQI